jgi:hydroxyacylglutathione hydrolase
MYNNERGKSRSRLLWRLGSWTVLSLVAIASFIAWRAPEISAWQWRIAEGKPTIRQTRPLLAPHLHWFDDYYVVEDLGQGAFAIGEPLYGQCNFSYLLIGTKRALLFDTGPGVRNIVPTVRALTSLPVTAFPSHLHFDHIGNLSRFSNVALPDLPDLRRQARNGQFRLKFYQYLGFVEGFKRPSFAVTQWLAPGTYLDLGDFRLEVMSAPGHTPESVILLDPKADRVFSGDFIYPSTIYAFLPGAKIADYRRSAERLAMRLTNNSKIYGGHGCDQRPMVETPLLHRADVLALGQALSLADTSSLTVGSGWYPRDIPVNENMRLLSKYPWMAQ